MLRTEFNSSMLSTSGTSLYFTLISFTTIGFGDVLPSEYDYIVIVGFLLLIGLSLVSTVLTLIQQQIEALASVIVFVHFLQGMQTIGAGGSAAGGGAGCCVRH